MTRADRSASWCLVFWMTTLTLFMLLAACVPAATSTPVPPTPTPTETGSVTVDVKKEGTRESFQKGEGVIVSVVGTDRADSIDDDGKLILLSCAEEEFISAWAPGYFIRTQPCKTDVPTYEFILPRMSGPDNAYYSWVEARVAIDPLRNCSGCHNDSAEHTEYAEWSKDGHSGVFTDPFFRTLYLGVDAYGNYNPNSPWGNIGFRIDYPADYGNCAFCHAPAAITGPQLKADLIPIISASQRGQPSAATEGVTCDVCHKVLDVKLGQDGFPFPDRPGVLSFDFARYEPNAQKVYVGPLPGIKPKNPDGSASDMKATCSPIFSRSEFCAPCHYGKFWDTVVYNSYGEWLEYKKNNKDNYRTCQECHMPQQNAGEDGALVTWKTDDPSKVTALDKVGRGRNACSENKNDIANFSHNAMSRPPENANDSNMIRGAATVNLDVSFKQGKNWIEANVTVRNVGAGHLFPTDSPLRHLILLLEAKDSHGTLLAQAGGPQIPLWGGMNDPQLGYAGRPGTIYANILLQTDTNASPTVAYWNPTQQAWKESDNRLPPNTDIKSTYYFAAPMSDEIRISARLIYRYAFLELMREKGWYRPDIVVAEDTKTVRVP